MERNQEERRGGPRHLCSHLLEVSAESGSQKAVLEDISLEGAAVAVEAAIEAAEVLELFGPDFHTRAEVRYCLRREADFRLGLRFLDGFRWRPDAWQPDHLWLPPAEAQDPQPD